MCGSWNVPTARAGTNSHKSRSVQNKLHRVTIYSLLRTCAAATTYLLVGVEWKELGITMKGACGLSR